MRMQFFPTPAQEEALNTDAAAKGVSTSVVLQDIVNQYYGLVTPNSKTMAQLEQDVLQEIQDFVSNPQNIAVPFDLNMASVTYSHIDMTFHGKPKVVKARIGKTFAKEIGMPGRFANVEQVFLPNGNPKRTVGNRAAVYVVPKKD